MRFKKHKTRIFEGDLTPMIDMTFQLIAFFMVLINFTQTEADERIQLPKSQLAKPPDKPLEFPIILQLTMDGDVIYAGKAYSDFRQLRPYLVNEAQVLENRGKPASDASVIIRGHQFVKFGNVQLLIQECQLQGFESFVLRAKEDVGNE